VPLDAVVLDCAFLQKHSHRYTDCSSKMLSYCRGIEWRHA